MSGRPARIESEPEAPVTVGNTRISMPEAGDTRDRVLGDQRRVRRAQRRLVHAATMDGMEQRISIDVAASPDRVWNVLVDVERWPEWTESVSSVRRLGAGPLAVGSRVEVSQPRIPTGTYTVTALQPGSAFTWEQRQPGSTVTAHHECTPLPDGGTRVELRVVMSGAVGGVVGRLYRKLTQRYLAMEAAGLKARAEDVDR
jgi:hypothetical protein